MNTTLFLPPEVWDWVLRWGVFSLEVALGALVVALLFRPFWLWYTGRSEVLERLKRLEDYSHKSLFELEMLNETLSVPLKKAAQKGGPKADQAPKAEEPMVVSEATKADFLKALERSRARILDEAPEPPQNKH